MLSTPKSVWIVKLNDSFVELRVSEEPVKIIRSKLTKTVKRTEQSVYGYGRNTRVPITVVMKHVHLEGGKSLGVYRTTILTKHGWTKYMDDGIGKLPKSTALRVRSKLWRQTNL